MDLFVPKLSMKQWFRLWGLSALVAILRVIMQLFIPDSGGMPFEPSAINKAGLIPLVFTIYTIITYGLLASVFVLLQSGMSGTRLLKGLKFGLLFGVMWTIYLIEPFPHTNGATIIDYISYPLADCIALVFLGLLLGRFCAGDSPKRKAGDIKNPAIQILLITVFFLAFRLFEYGVLKYYSSFYERQALTLLWTLIAGLWVGFMYFYLSPAIPIKSKLVKIVVYSFIVFGIDLCLCNYFIALVFKVNSFEILIKCLFDIGAVMVGAFISHYIKIKG